MDRDWGREWRVSLPWNQYLEQQQRECFIISICIYIYIVRERGQKFFFFSCVLGGWKEQKQNEKRTGREQKKWKESVCFNSVSRCVDFFSIERHKNEWIKSTHTNSDLPRSSPLQQIYSWGKSPYAYAQILSAPFCSLFCSFPLLSVLFSLLLFSFHTFCFLFVSP